MSLLNAIGSGHILTTPITHVVTPVIPILNLLTKPSPKWSFLCGFMRRSLGFGVALTSGWSFTCIIQQNNQCGESKGKAPGT